MPQYNKINVAVKASSGAAFPRLQGRPSALRGSPSPTRSRRSSRSRRSTHTRHTCRSSRSRRSSRTRRSNRSPSRSRSRSRSHSRHRLSKTVAHDAVPRWRTGHAPVAALCPANAFASWASEEEEAWAPATTVANLRRQIEATAMRTAATAPQPRRRRGPSSKRRGHVRRSRDSGSSQDSEAAAAAVFGQSTGTRRRRQGSTSPYRQALRPPWGAPRRDSRSALSHPEPPRVLRVVASVLSSDSSDTAADAADMEERTKHALKALLQKGGEGAGV